MKIYADQRRNYSMRAELLILMMNINTILYLHGSRDRKHTVHEIIFITAK